MAKFHVGQMVKYVGREGVWSPAKGTIGKVLKIGAFDCNFLVDYPIFANGMYCYFNENELEPVDEDDIMRAKEAIKCWSCSI